MRLYFSRVKWLVAFFFIMQALLRLALLVRGWNDVPLSAIDVTAIMLRGLWFDSVVACFVVIAPAMLYTFIPDSMWRSPWGVWVDGLVRFSVFGLLVFDALAEYVFWAEFQSRFNFIAVDYLVYTQEVIGNIVESYPLGWLLSGVAVVAAALSWLTLRGQQSFFASWRLGFFQKLRGFAVVVGTASVLCFLSNADQASFVSNDRANELSSNGIYNLFHAFWANEIDYDRFYKTYDAKAMHVRMKEMMSEERDAVVDDLLVKTISSAGAEMHNNVIIVVMESMSADYMGLFGNEQQLTPCLDRIGKEGLLFTQAYATGTRTVRGLEAVSLALPPTPGQSILRRPGYENLFSIGDIFKERGYDTKFIYGGHGYFDNMNAFFGSNSFDVVDRSSMAQSDIHFSNVWGVSDEDLFAEVLRRADASYQNGKPFMDVVMTTSNHRPYTYPDGCIDIPSKTGREGAVKYADYSVGQLIAAAKQKPWFKNTIFVFVADHTAGAARKMDLDPKNYHIPLIFYAPHIVLPGSYDKIVSQIDLPPMLLGILHFSYRSKFYGINWLNNPKATPRTFISNYQKVGLVKHDVLTVLEPKKEVRQYSWPDNKPKDRHDESLERDAVAYYQTASLWRTMYRRLSTMAAGELKKDKNS